MFECYEIITYFLINWEIIDWSKEERKVEERESGRETDVYMQAGREMDVFIFALKIDNITITFISNYSV